MNRLLPIFNKLENQLGRDFCQIGLTNMHLKESFIWELATDSRLLDLIQILLGNSFKMLSTHFFCKYPGKKTKSFVAWHQDVTYWELKPPKVCGAWIALDDSDIENGCMRVISGSHRQGLIDHGISEKEGNMLGHNQQIEEKYLKKNNIVNLCLNAGQISIHDGLLIHSSNPNRSKRRRCGLTVRFIPNTTKHKKNVSLYEFKKEGETWLMNKDEEILREKKDSYLVNS